MITEEEKVSLEGLCINDPQIREVAMKNIRDVQAKVNVTEPVMTETDPPNHLNQALARLLMLSKRCPFPDVRVKSHIVLKLAEVGVITPQAALHDHSQWFYGQSFIDL